MLPVGLPPGEDRTAVRMTGWPKADWACFTDAVLLNDIYAASSGGPVAGGVFRANRKTAGAQDQPAVTMIEGGKFVISWTSPDRELEGVMAHVFSEVGARIEQEFQVNTNEAGSQRGSVLAPLGAGVDFGKTYVALWSWLARDGDEDIVFQRFAAP